MKTFFILILSVALAQAGVSMLDLNNIRLEGVNAGCLEDVLANYSSRATEVKDAATVFVESKAQPPTPLTADEAKKISAEIKRCEAKGIVISQTVKTRVADAQK